MADRIFLIDAMAFAFRSYYAIRTALTDNEGRPTNAIFGFTRVLVKLLREQNPSHIAVVFDAPGKTFRDEMYAEYKATRRETPEDLLEQFPRMHEVVEAMSLPLLSVPGFEADDVIGTLARQAEANGIEAVIVSGDKDLLQLVSSKITVYDPNKGDNGTWLREDDVAERFGVGPAHVVDALALIGDAADNVPGVRGIGDKTAKKLMAKYGSLEGLYEHIGELKGKQKEKLIEDRDQAFASRELVTIRVDVPLELSIDDCRRSEMSPEQVALKFQELAFHSLLEELVPDAIREEDAARDYQLVTSEKELKAMAARMKKNGCFAVDTETTSTEPMRAELVGLSFSCKGGTGYYVPVAHTPEACAVYTDPEDLTSLVEHRQLEKETALALLKPLLEDPGLGKVGHNIKYDILVLRRAGIELRGVVMDTMVASYLTDPSKLRHNLDEVSLQYLRQKPIPISELIGKGAKAVTFDSVPLDRACEYASEDADLTWRLYQVFQPELEKRALTGLFEEVELPLISVLAGMEETGIAIDHAVFGALKTEIEARLGELEQEIFELAGEPFKVNSPKQLQGILFDKLGLKPIRKTKTGYSTDVDVLEALAREHALPGKVLEFRGLEKLRGAYVEALPKLVNPATGRIHTSFNQAVAATGRLSSSDPNLQNIPIRTPMGRRIREGFVPAIADGCLVSADYSQIELRILAHLSQDAALMEAFAQGADIHRDTAARVFGVAADAVTPDMRRQAKAVNFGVVYGISAFGLARNLGTTNSEAQRFIDEYFNQYQQVRQWLDDTVRTAKELGYVTTLLQRRRYVPELKSSDVNTRRAAERAAINTPVQGSAADIIKLAMVRLSQALEGRKSRMLLQVHDELVLECPQGEAQDVLGLTREVMENAVQLDVMLKVDTGMGGNWAEIH